jgi:hypothetical protein
MLPLHQRRDAALVPPLPVSSSSNTVPSFLSLSAGQLQGEARSVIDEVRMQRLYEKLERHGHLARREPKSDNKLVRAMDAIFAPEVIQIGGTSIAFSPYTAIKRKNPLCLLNPVPIAVSW